MYLISYPENLTTYVRKCLSYKTSYHTYASLQYGLSNRRKRYHYCLWRNNCPSWELQHMDKHRDYSELVFTLKIVNIEASSGQGW